MIAAEVPQKRYFSHNFCGARYGYHYSNSQVKVACYKHYSYNDEVLRLTSIGYQEVSKML